LLGYFRRSAGGFSEALAFCNFAEADAPLPARR
jgi:hypothetical protein